MAIDPHTAVPLIRFMADGASIDVHSGVLRWAADVVEAAREFAVWQERCVEIVNTIDDRDGGYGAASGEREAAITRIMKLMGREG